jgi:hypothetical protein
LIKGSSTSQTFSLRRQPQRSLNRQISRDLDFKEIKKNRSLLFLTTVLASVTIIPRGSSALNKGETKGDFHETSVDFSCPRLCHGLAADRTGSQTVSSA